MKTYLIGSGEDGRCRAFEIEHTFVWIGTIARLLAGVSGVTDVYARRLFRSPDDIRLSFRYLGRECIVWEPWGDSSRYWIGPKDEGDFDIAPIRAAFEGYHPGSVLADRVRALFRRGSSRGSAAP